MNPLTSLLLLANPIITAALTVVLFLESKKHKSLLATVEMAIVDSSRQVIEAVERQKDSFDAIATSLNAISKDQERSVETFEKAIIDSSRQVIEAVERQKDGFDAIAISLKTISEDQGRSVETFTGISSALTTSSTTNERSLNNLVIALNNANENTDKSLVNLSQRIEQSDNELKTSLHASYSDVALAIKSTGIVMGEEYTRLSERLSSHEGNTTNAFDRTLKSQQNSNENLANSISADVMSLKEGIDSNAKELTLLIPRIAEKIAEEYNKMSERLSVYEKNTKEAFETAVSSQQLLSANLANSISGDVKSLKDGIDVNSKELNAIESTLKKAVSI